VVREQTGKPGGGTTNSNLRDKKKFREVRHGIVRRKTGKVCVRSGGKKKQEGCRKGKIQMGEQR